MKFSSDGFDVDQAGDDVILELGGGTSQVVDETKAPRQEEEVAASPPSEMDHAEELKALGNQAFKEANYEEACRLYSEAIDATPGMNADELMKLQEDWKNEQEKAWRKKLQEKDERERQKKQKRREREEKGEKVDDDDDEEEEVKPEEKPAVFVAPPHAHGHKLAVYHCNRAAARLHLEMYEECIQDCTVAILWKPDYSKAYLRRASAYEKLPEPKTDLALADAKAALALDPSPALRKTVQRLEKIEHERIEKLKTETLDKLKDLGNSILGNFGLSIDNFKAVQDPNTGSYSISFQN